MGARSCPPAVPRGASASSRNGFRGSVAGQSFPRVARLRHKTEFDAVFQDGRRLRGSLFRVHALRREGEPARLGLAITKRVVPLAAQRNRVKRLVRELFRGQRDALVGWQLVVGLHANPTSCPVQLLRGDLQRLLSGLSARASN